MRCRHHRRRPRWRGAGHGACRATTSMWCCSRRAKRRLNTTDPRALALAYGTRLLLQRLGAWEAIQNVSGIKIIEVTQKNSPGHTILRADEIEGAGNGLRASLYRPARRVAAGIAAIRYQLPVRRSSQRPAQLERRTPPSPINIRGKNTNLPRASPSSPKAANCSRHRTRRRFRTMDRAASSPMSPARNPRRARLSSISPRKDRWRCCPIWMDTNWY